MKLGREDVEEIELVVDGTVDDESCTEVDGDFTELEEVRSRGAGVEEIELSRMRYTLSNEMLVDAPKPLQEPCR